MPNMFNDCIASSFIYLWIVVSTVTYFAHYVVEVIFLDLPITGQSPCSAHAYLKQLIQRFSGEATELSSLRRSEDHPARPEETLSDRTYEDLLSTAIINKVVQTSQNEARSSTNSSRASATTKRAESKEYFFGEETLENKWKNHGSIHDDASSVSSLDDWVRSDSSIASSKYVDRVSLTIKQHIEEGTSSDEEALDNISNAPENSFLNPNDDSWHENWYFQKRRLTNSSSPVPVPMLVPNPITEAKVLIGDKEAEDLSDIGSDYGDPEVVPDIKNILVNSKTIIGGKNVIHSVDESLSEFHSIENTQIENDIEEIRPEVVVIETETSEVQNERISRQITETQNEDILMSIESNTEQDTEYTEQYASLPRTFLKSSSPISRIPVSGIYTEQAKKMPENSFEIHDQVKPNKFSLLAKNVSDSSDEESMGKNNVFKGSYSEREKEKWKHSSVEIPDNPYSPKNLERRLSSRSSNGSSSSTFGRDYYVRNAARSTGTRKATNLSIDSEGIEYSSTLNGNEDNSQETVTSLVMAVPVVAEPEESNDFESISESSIVTPTRPPIHDISSDSDLSIERVYNLQSGRVFEKKGELQQEILTEDSYSPEGLKYVPKEFDEDIRSFQRDENHNNTTNKSKIEFMRSLTETDANTENDHVDGDVLDHDEDADDLVPYDDNKFKATLEIFKAVSERTENNKIEKPEKLIAHPEPSRDILKVHAAEKITEISEIYKIEPVNTADSIELHKYFGDAKKIVDIKINTSDYSEEEMLSDNREFSLEYSTDLNEDDLSRTVSSLEADPEIIDLKEKRLVKDLLGKFSMNYPNISLSPASIKKTEEQIQVNEISFEASEMIQTPEIAQATEIDAQFQGRISPVEELDTIPSVQNLKQLFDKENITSKHKKNQQQIYSLTARSLSKQFRQQLKSDDEISLQNEENVADSYAGNEEDSQLLPTDIARNMIAFFEDLENKNKHT